MNEKEFEFLGIKRFHEAGYKGQGIKVASHEEIVEDVFDDVFVLNYGQKGNDYSEHRNFSNGLYSTSCARC